MTHQVLARKWRPKAFDQVVGQDQVIRTLQNALTQGYLHHAYLFTGTRGVGKTSIARILAKCLNCEQGISATPCGTCSACVAIDEGRFPDLYEIDAASRTKVEDTREILDNVPYSPTQGRYKVYLIDEVHMLSGHSFNALLKTLEEPPEHVKFLLATTDPQKLPATVLSRCLQFHLLQVPVDVLSQHLAHVLTEEKISFENEAVTLIAKAANGSVRDSLSILDQGIAFGNGSVNTADVRTMLGSIEQTDLLHILQALQQQDGNALLQAAEQLNQKGADLSHALSDLLELLHQVTVLQLLPESGGNPELADIAKQLLPENVQLFYQIGVQGLRDLSSAPSPRTGFEMTLLRMLAFIPDDSVEPVATNAAAPRTSAAPSSNKATSKPAAKTAPTTRATVAATGNQWADVVAQIKLSGASLALAQHCSLVKHDGNDWQLALENKHKPLLSDTRRKAIATALSEHFGQPNNVDIQIGSGEAPTPQQSTNERLHAKQQDAEQSIKTDPSVQQIMQTFGAEIVEGSINPSESSS